MDEIEERTTLLRESALPMFRRIRELLEAQRIEAQRAALAQLFTDDNSFEFGIVVTPHGGVFQFGYDYLGRDPGSGNFAEFEDLTLSWERSEYRDEIATARSFLAAPNQRS